MPKFQVDWHVVEVVNGIGDLDDGKKDGEKTICARGSVEIDKTNENELRKELMLLLKQSYPEHALRSTYDLNRSYVIEVTEVI